LEDFANVANHNANLNPMQQEDCLTEENFEKAFHYIQWKQKTSKKLSKTQKVLFSKGYELDAIEETNGKRRIVFFKKDYKYFSVDVQDKYIPHTQVVDIPQNQIYFCELVNNAKFANLPTNYLYKYIDGNNNIWVIDDKSIEYEPIATENSSSGMYSGGEPFKKYISLEQYKAIQALLKKALANSSIHLENRNMGCGTILEMVTESITVKYCYLPMNHEEKKSIETLLNQWKQ